MNHSPSLAGVLICPIQGTFLRRLLSPGVRALTSLEAFAFSRRRHFSAAGVCIARRRDLLSSKLSCKRTAARVLLRVFPA